MNSSSSSPAQVPLSLLVYGAEFTYVGCGSKTSLLAHMHVIRIYKEQQVLHMGSGMWPQPSVSHRYSSDLTESGHRLSCPSQSCKKAHIPSSMNAAEGWGLRQYLNNIGELTAQESADAYSKLVSFDRPERRMLFFAVEAPTLEALGLQDPVVQMAIVKAVSTEGKDGSSVLARASLAFKLEA